MTNISLSSAELGNLWQAYQEKSMKLHVLERFIENVGDEDARSVLQSAYETESKNKNAIESIFQTEGATVPDAFGEKDVNKTAPLLFDDHFYLMYLRLLSKILIGLYSLHSGMSYRQDIFNLYKDFTADSQNIYYSATQYLLNKGVLPRPPIIQMPKEAEFVENLSYTSGLNPFKKHRPLDTVEIGLVYQTLETNITGMKLMTGYAQVANDPEVQKYFSRGKELAKQIISTMSELLLESDLEAPSTWTGMVTDSTMPPFSDKLMMYNVNLFSMFGLGSDAVGGGLSFRSDIIAKMGRIAAKTFTFTKDGAKLRIKKGWMEEPPQVIDRDQLTKKRA